jgi:hypothetical protein
MPRRPLAALALLGALLLALPALPLAPADPGTQTVVPPGQVFVHNSAGFLPSVPPEYGTLDFRVADLLVPGAEPSTGVLSDGTIFFQAFTQTWRSQDNGVSWQDVTPLTADPTTSDPMLWVDQDTDRVYADQLLIASYVGCSWASWSDDGGDLWTGANPLFCNMPPVANDHQKLTTGRIPPGHMLAGVLPYPYPVYQNAVYYTWNNFLGGTTKVAMSLDGGYTFPFSSQAAAGTCSGGLEGRLRVLPDGSLLLPKRDCNSIKVARSTNFDNWQLVPVGASVGVTSHRKNPDIGVDTGGNAYVSWSSGCAGGVCAEPAWMSFTTDKGVSWSSPVKASPPNVLSTTFHSVVAGAPGRIAILYYGNDHSDRAPDHVDIASRWHAYITFSLDAMDPDPTFVTVQLDTDADPIQIGCISTNSDGHCAHRNLLDFTDIVRTIDGKVIAAYADGCIACAAYAQSTSRNGISAIQLGGPDLVPGV